MSMLGVGIVVGITACALGAAVFVRLASSALRDDPERIRLTRRLVVVAAGGLCIAGVAVLLAGGGNSDGQIGTALLQTGIAVLAIGFLNFELLIDDRMPKALFGHGYFAVAGEKERVKLLKSSIGALAGLEPALMDDVNTIFPAYFPAVRDFIEQTFKAPVRYNYAAVLSLEGTVFEEIVEAPCLHQGLLATKIEYTYNTECNRLRQPVRVNGDGVVHRVDVQIPSELQLHSMLCGLPQLPKKQIYQWIMSNMRPEVWVQIAGEDERLVKTQIPIKEIVAYGNGDEPRRLQFPIMIDTMLAPGASMQVRYIQRSAAKRSDAHHWVAFSVTRGFTMSSRDFFEQGFGIVPIAEPTPWSKRIEGAPGPQNVHQNAAIRLDGIVFPGATFGYAWHPIGADGSAGSEC